MLVRSTDWPFISSFLVIGLIGGLIGGVAYHDTILSALQGCDGAERGIDSRAERSKPGSDAKSTLPKSDATQVTLPGERKVRLDELAPGRPAAIVVMKGAWCPVCQRQLKRLSRQMARVQFEGGAVFGLTTASVEENRRLMKKLGLNFPILSDASKKLHEQFDLWLEDKCHAMPGVIFLDAQGQPVKVHRGRYPGSPQDSMILRTLDQIAGR